MTYLFTVRIELERLQGKFATRQELEEQLQELLEQADPQQLEGDNGGEYEVSSWEVEAQEMVRIRRRRVPRRRSDTLGKVAR